MTFLPQNTVQEILPPVACINTYVQPGPEATSNKIKKKKYTEPGSTGRESQGM